MDKIIDDIMNGKHKLSPYGEFVRGMRQSRGLYLKQMADFIGINSAQMSGIEFGRHELTKEILQKTFEFFAQAPAVEPAQRCNCCGYLVTDSEHRGCLRAAKQEPAQAVPVDSGFAPKMRLITNDELSEFAERNRAHLEKSRLIHSTPTAPPAIDDDTKKMVLELCRMTIDRGMVNGGVTTDMEVIAGQIRKKLEAGLLCSRVHSLIRLRMFPKFVRANSVYDVANPEKARCEHVLHAVLGRVESFSGANYKSFEITAAIRSASNGGTALPTCTYCCVLLPTKK